VRLAEIERLLVCGLLARECQQPARQVCAALCGVHRHLDEFGRITSGRAPLGYEFQVAHNDGQQIVEVVGDPARQLPHGLHLLCLTERLLGIFQLGNLQLDDHGLDQLARIIEDRCKELPDIAVILSGRAVAQLEAARPRVFEVSLVEGFVALAILWMNPLGLVLVGPILD